MAKRLLIILAAALFLLSFAAPALFAGPGGGEKPAGEATFKETATSGPVKRIIVPMGGWVVTEFPVKTVVGTWNLNHPGISIVYDINVDWNANQAEWAKGNTLVDLWYADTSDAVSFGWKNVASIDEYVPKEVRDDLFPSVIPAAVNPEGKLISVPHLMEIATLNYRKDVLKDAGLAVPKTIDQFYQAAKKINNPPKMYGMDMDLPQDDRFVTVVYMSLLQSTTGKAFSADGVLDTSSAAAIALFKKFKQWYDEGLIPEVALVGQAPDIFKAGNAAMLIGWQSRAQWAMDVLGDAVTVAPLPSGGVGGTILADHGLLVSSYSKYKKEAVDFLVNGFARNPVFQQGMIAAGKVPPFISMYVKGKMPDWMVPLKDGIAKGTTRPGKPWLSASKDAVGLAIYKVLKEGKSAEDALAEATETINKAKASAQ